ncbi:MAG: HEAT repeat domain-containing protein [Candidatus Riflebacteria bacterium]|nr:HEAT repeat domain-containing protein [Candidatus Riflebacteria bacterium]
MSATIEAMENRSSTNTHSDQAEHDFVELLNQVGRDPKAFAERIGPVFRADPEHLFPALMNAFDLAPSQLGPLIANQLKGPLRSRMAQILLPTLENPVPERFSWAAAILAEVGEASIIPLMIKALDHPHNNVVLAAVRTLALFQDADSLAALTRFICAYEDEVCLSAAFRYLVPLGYRIGSDLVEKLPAMTHARSGWVLKYLAESGVACALPAFRKALEEQPLEFGIFAITGLGRIGTPEAVSLLVNYLHHEEWFLRKRVVDALGQSKIAQAVAPLIEALTDPSVQIRKAAVESLSKIGGLALELLIKALDSGTHDHKIGLIRALGQIHDRRVVEPLTRSLSDRTSLFFSIDAIGDLGFVEAAPALIPFLKDPEWFNRLNALEALANIHAPNMRDLAHDCLEDSNDMVRNAAQRILTSINGVSEGASTGSITSA